MAEPTVELAYARGEDNPPLLTETIGQTLARTTDAYGENLALVDAPSGRTWTYREFRTEVLALAAGLLRHGVQAGDRVGLWAPNRPEWVMVQYATAEIGAILVNLNPAYRQNELDYALTQSGTSVVLAAERYKDSDYRGMLDAARPSTPELREVILFETPEWDELLTRPSDDELAAVAQRASTLRPDDSINIQYTSGTTGFPKGATLTHANISNNGYLVGELLAYTDADRICIPVPFYHCFGMVMGNLAATSHGAAMVIPSPTFDPEAALRAVADYRCTSLYGVPTMFIAELALLDHVEPGQYDLSSLRTGIMAGSPCPEHVMRQVVDRMHMGEVSICYGMTETSPVSCQTRVDDPLERALQMGIAYVRFAVDTPVLYREAFHHVSPVAERSKVDEVLAASAFVRFTGTVSELADAGIFGPDEVGDVVLELWTAAHGLASLMIAKPGLGWGDDFAIAAQTLRSICLGRAVLSIREYESPDEVRVFLDSLSAPSDHSIGQEKVKSELERVDPR